LFIGQQLGIVDDVDEEYVRDLQAQFRFLFVGHMRLRNIAPLQFGKEVVDLHGNGG
jgi:hypothetical protein